MKITREINGEQVEIELTEEEMNLAYEEVRKEKWEDCIRDRIEMESESLRFTDGFGKEEFVSECMDETGSSRYAENYEWKAEEIVFDVAETNNIWVSGDE